MNCYFFAVCALRPFFLSQSYYVSNDKSQLFVTVILPAVLPLGIVTENHTCAVVMVHNESSTHTVHCCFVYTDGTFTKTE